MASNNIELKIGSTFNGEGFRKLDGALKSSAGKVRSVSGAVGGMLGAMDGLDGAVGKFTRTAGNLLGGFLSLGIWGGIIGAASALFGWLGKIREEHSKVNKAFQPYVINWHDAEATARGYARSLEAMKKKVADREKAEKDAAAAAARAAKAEADAMDKKMAMEREYDQYLMKTAALKEKIAGLSDSQIAVNSAQRQLDFANKWGGQMDQGEAQLALDLAKKKASEAYDALADGILKELDAADAQANAEKAAAVAAEKKAKAEEKKAKVEEASAKKIQELDDKMAKLREEAARLEENAARARGGKTFGEWQRGERELQREQKKADVRQAKVINNAEKEIAQLEREQRSFGKGFSKARADRLAKLREFVADQDPNNNPALKEAERLEKEKKLTMDELNTQLTKIATALKDGGVAI